MFHSIMALDVKDWESALTIIGEFTKLKTIALEFSAELIDEELIDSDADLLYICDTINHQDNHTIQMMKTIWQRTINSADQKYTGRRVGSNEKILICNIYTAKLANIGEVQFKSDHNGRGELTVVMQPKKASKLNVEKLAKGDICFG